RHSKRWFLAFALWALAVVCPVWADDPPKKSDDKPAPPVKMTAQEDHKRMMELLKFKELRRGPSGNPKAENSANYDESKANPYPTRPDPRTLKNGQKATPAEQWFKQRRPEIVEDFDREIYGRVPKETPKVKWEVTATEKQKVGDVAAITKR